MEKDEKIIENEKIFKNKMMMTKLLKKIYLYYQ